MRFSVIRQGKTVTGAGKIRTMRWARDLRALGEGEREWNSPKGMEELKFVQASILHLSLAVNSKEDTRDSDFTLVPQEPPLVLLVPSVHTTTLQVWESIHMIHEFIK